MMLFTGILVHILAADGQSREVQSLRGEMARAGLRYLTLIETMAADMKRDPLDGVWVIGRINGGMPATNTTTAPANIYRLVAFSPRHQRTALTLISTDTGVAANMDVFYEADLNGFVAIGGGSDAHAHGQGMVAHSAAKNRNFTLAPVELMPIEASWQRILEGAWLERNNAWAPLVDGWGSKPPGCVSTKDAPACNMVRPRRGRAHAPRPFYLRACASEHEVHRQAGSVGGMMG